MPDGSQHKRAAAAAALEHITPECCLGIGSGSTVSCFIEELAAAAALSPSCVVAASDSSTRQLEQHGIRTTPLQSAGTVDIYIDGADEIDDNLQMIKGGGGAHTREKIIACSAKHFIAIADSSKKVSRLGNFPLAVEVIPLARGYVARQIAALGGNIKWREGFVTDNGNWILDVRELDLTHAAEMERQLNLIPGVVENGLFAVRRADAAIIADDSGTRLYQL